MSNYQNQDVTSVQVSNKTRVFTSERFGDILPIFYIEPKEHLKIEETNRKTEEKKTKQK